MRLQGEEAPAIADSYVHHCGACGTTPSPQAFLRWLDGLGLINVEKARYFLLLEEQYKVEGGHS